jgi:cell division protein FtsW
MLIGMVVGLVMLEPDMGTSIILLSIAFSLYFFSNAPIVHFLLILPVLVVGIIGLAIASPYRMQRLLTFMNPTHDPQGASYHMTQALLAFGSGGWFGVGIGKSRQKYEYLPEANTDSIFAIIGEEVGFVGATIVLLGFLFVVWRIFRIAARIKDPFGRFIALGVGSWVGWQTCINMGAMVALIPLTGVPLPFVSYGGSSLVVLLFAMGIVANISKHE